MEHLDYKDNIEGVDEICDRAKELKLMLAYESIDGNGDIRTIIKNPKKNKMLIFPH